MSREAWIGGDAMGSGGNFAKRLTIDGNGFLTEASGPLDASDTDVNIKLYAYVYQMRPDGSGAVFTSELEAQDIATMMQRQEGVNPIDLQWRVQRAQRGVTTKEEVTEQDGTFEPGPATGVALTVARPPDEEDPRRTVMWWTDTLTLIPEA